MLLAAGAVHTPQILQLSGIGPKQALQEQGIPVVADVAGVGENLQVGALAHLPATNSRRVQSNFAARVDLVVMGVGGLVVQKQTVAPA